MIGRNEVSCRSCGATSWQDIRDPNGMGCACGGTMEPTGTMEYDEEFVEEERHAQEVRRDFDEYDRRGYYA